MIINKVSSLFKNILSIAGSSNHAVAEVLPATKIEKKTARNILFKKFHQVEVKLE